MGNFTAQKVYQDITKRQSAQNTVHSNGGNGFGGGSGGAKKPMTLAEHDKLVHGGHYDGGRCKFRQQLAAKGMLPPNSGAGNGGASVGGGQMSLGDKVRQIGANARNAIRGGMEKVEGAAKEVGGAVKSAVANVHEKAEQLSKKLAEAEGQTEKSSSNLEKMGKILSGFKSPEIKEKAAAICQKVVNAINGVGNSESNHNVDSNSWKNAISRVPRVRVSNDPSNHMTKVGATSLSDVLRNGSLNIGDSFITENGDRLTYSSNYKMSNGMQSYVFKKDDGTEVKGNAFSLGDMWKEEDISKYLDGNIDNNTSSGQSQGQPDFNPKTHEEVDKWFNDESDKLEGMHKRGEISDDEYNSRVDELESKNDSYRDALNKQGVKSKEDMSDLSDKSDDNSSPRRKNLRDALREHLASKVDNNTATEKDDEDAEYMDAHSANESMLKRGRISEEEFKKHRKEINDDYMKKQFARQFGVNYKPYSPKESNGNAKGNGGKDGDGKSISELNKRRKDLQSKLEDFQFFFGKNSLVGKFASGMVSDKISDIDSEIAKMTHLQKEAEKNANAQKSKLQGEKKQSGGLRSIHGEINHGGNSEVQSLIDQMEDEYRNAKKSSEKIRIMSSYKKLKDMYEPKQTATKTSRKTTTPNGKSDGENASQTSEIKFSGSDKFPKTRAHIDGIGESDALALHEQLRGKTIKGMQLSEQERFADRYISKKFGVDSILSYDD